MAFSRMSEVSSLIQRRCLLFVVELFWEVHRAIFVSKANRTSKED